MKSPDPPPNGPDGFVNYETKRVGSFGRRLTTQAFDQANTDLTNLRRRKAVTNFRDPSRLACGPKFSNVTGTRAKCVEQELAMRMSNVLVAE